MNSIDIAIIILLALGFITGYIKGLIKIIISLAMFIVSIFLSISFSGKVKTLLQSLFTINDLTAVILSFVLIFVICSIISAILIKLFNIKKGITGLVNRLGGGALGIIQISIFISAILILMNIFSFPSDNSKKDSLLYNPMMNFVPTTFTFVKKIFPSTSDFFNSIENINGKIKSVNI